MALKLRQGLAADRTSITPATGELIYTTDTKFVYVGDGTTPGGNLISGAVATDLNGLSDVVITSASNGQVLKYNGVTWVNDTVAGGSTNLDGLTDVVITSASNGQVLKYNGSNWVNAAESGGGGGMTNFLVSGDDSSTRTIADGNTLSIIGNNNIQVYWDEFNNLTIDSTSGVNSGTAGQLSFYQTSGNLLSSTGPDLTYNNSTGVLNVAKIDTNSIVTNETNFSIFNTTGLNTIGLGGLLDGTAYSGRIVQYDVGPVDPNAPFSCAFRNIHNNVFINAILLERSRGTISSQTAVQASDVLHAIIWSGHDGTGQRQAVVMAGICEQTPSPGIMPGAFLIQTQNTSGSNETALYIGADQYLNCGGALKHNTFGVDTTGGNATLTKAQVRGNFLFSNPLGATRTINLPLPNSFIAGLRLLVLNISVSQSLVLSSNAVPITTVTAGNRVEIGTEGTFWFVI